MDVYAYKMYNEKERKCIMNFKRHIGNVYVLFDVEKSELIVFSKTGRFNIFDIISDMFGIKDISQGADDRYIIKNRNEIHFQMLLSRLREME